MLIFPHLFSVERGPQKTCREHGSFPSSSLLHAWICPTHQQRIPTVSCIDSSRTHPADVWCQEHDGCLWSKAWSLPDCGSHVSWPHVHEGGGWTDAQCSEQEQFLLRGMDPQQCEDCCLWHPAPWSEDVLHLHWQQHCHPGAIQAHQWTVHCYVQAKGFLALVHWWRHGWDGIHWGKTTSNMQNQK